ncbi:MAG: hypothetical protein O3A00_02300 [Planctomycetota bacterium]|nr:hypothetical protein [Planctomycetota bacterium]
MSITQPHSCSIPIVGRVVGSAAAVLTTLRATLPTTFQLAITLSVLWHPANARAQGLDVSRLPPIEEIHVPANDLQQHLTPQHVAMDLAEYRRLLKTAIPEPSTVRVDRTDYSAKFVDASLQLGRLTASVTNDAAVPRLLLLDPLNLNVSVLNWARDGAKRPAIWGTTPAGKIVLLVDPGTHRLDGIWRFDGTKLPDRVDFSLQLIPAAVSRLTIETAGEEIVNSLSGVATKGGTNGEGWAEWVVPIGGRTECRLQVSKTESVRRLPPTVFIESSQAFRLLKDEARVNVGFVVDAVHAAIDQVDITVPTDWEVLSLKYTGDFSLTWSRDEDTPTLLHVDLPNRVLGRSREILLQAVRPLPPPTVWRSPLIGIRSCRLVGPPATRITATLLRGTLDLSISKPLQVQSLVPTGCLQRQVVLNSKEAESFSFEQLLANGRLMAVLGPPDPRLEAGVVSSLKVDEHNWTLTSLIEWKAGQSATYRMQCLIQSGWEVLEVRNQAAGESEVQWSLSPIRRLAKRTLTIEFPRAVSAKHSVRLLVALRKRRQTGINEFQLEIPVFDLVDCQRVARTLAVDGGSRRRPRVESQSYVAVSRAVLAESVSNDLKTLGINDDVAKIYVADQSLSPAARISTVDQTQAIQVQAVTTAEMDRSALIETCRLDIKPSRAVDRIMLFLSTNGPAPIWEMDAEPITILPLRQLPDRHEEWGLPVPGELWELRFSQPISVPFTVRATRRRAVGSIDFATVCSVVNAEAFQGRIDLGGLADSLLEASPLEMTAISSSELRGRLKPEELATSPTFADGTQWSYVSTDSRLKLAIQPVKGSRAPPTARLRLESELFAQAAQEQLHVATYELDESSSRHPFEFQLAEPARLIAIRVNGKPVTADRGDRGWVLPPVILKRRVDADADRVQRTISLHYACPIAKDWLISKQTVIVPQTTHTVTGIQWRLTLPSADEPTRIPSGLTLGEQPRQLSWTRRLFGPLGRTAAELVFAPHEASSWIGLVTKTSESPVVSGRPTSSGWTTWTLRGFDLPRVVELTTWNRLDAMQLGWVSLLVCLCIGIALRISGYSKRDRITAVWLAVSLTAVIFVPVAFADVAGGCFTGSLIAAMLPRRLLHKRSLDEVASDGSSVHSPSQVIIKMSATIALLSALIVMNDAACAQDDARLPLRIVYAGDANPATRMHRVIIPDSDLPIAYLPNRLLAELRALNQGDLDADYVISNAEYVCDVNGRNSASVLARYRISVLKPNTTTRIHLPIEGAVLQGPDACQVNGQACPVLPAANATGFVLEFESPKPASKPASKPATTEAGEQSEPAVPVAAPNIARTQTSPNDTLENRDQRDQVVTLNIELRLRTRTHPIEAGGSCHIKIPAIPSQVEAIVDRKYRNVGITGAAIQSQQTGTRHHITGLLQLGGVLHVAWSTEQAVIDEPPKVEAAIHTIVEVLPTRIRYHVFTRYRVLSGNVRSLEWRVPSGFILRDMQAAEPMQAFLLPDVNRLRVISAFNAPISGALTVYAKFEQPFRNLKERLRMPLIEPVFREMDGVLTRNQVAFAALSEFELAVNATPVEVWTGIETKTFRSDVAAIIGSMPIVPPVVRFAFQIHRAGRVDLSLKPRSATRQVWKNLSGIIHTDRIEWQLDAEIRTSKSGAFHHSLELDRRLIIHSISVIEGGVDRLVRWSRIPHPRDSHRDLVVLFLSGPTDADLQNLKLNTTVPHGNPDVVAFPSITLQDAEIVESRVQTYLASGDEPTVPPCQALERLSVEAESDDNAPGRILGRFNWDESKPSPELRFDELAKLLVVDRVLIMRPNQSGTARESIQVLRFENTPADRIIELVIPNANHDVVEVKLLNSVAAELVLEDAAESIHATIQCKQAARELLVAIQTSHTNEGALDIEDIKCDRATNGRHLLVIEPSVGVVDSAMQTKRVRIGEIPTWIANLPMSDRISIESIAFRRDATATSWRIIPNATDPTDSIRVTLAKHEIRLASDGKMLGTTRFFISGSDNQSVRLTWPPTLLIKGIQLDGRAVAATGMPDNGAESDRTSPVDSDRTRSLELPLTSSSSLHELLVWWSHTDKLPTYYGVQSFEWPALEDTHIERSLVLCLAESSDFVTARSGAQKLDNAAYLQTLHESLRENLSLINANLSRDAERHENPRHVLRSDVAMFRKLLHGEAQASSISIEQRATYESFDKTLAKDFIDASSDEAASFSSSIGGDQPLVVLGELTGQPVSVWILREPTIAWPAAGIAMLLMLTLIWRLIRLKSGDRLARHPSLAWCLLGLLWWQCLTPSGIGLLLIVRGAWLLVRPMVLNSPRVVLSSGQPFAETAEFPARR